jgi:hypothetical protein
MSAPAITEREAALEAVLRSLEWVVISYRGYEEGCPSCGHVRATGHASDCALADVLGIAVEVDA